MGSREGALGALGALALAILCSMAAAPARADMSGCRAAEKTDIYGNAIRLYTLCIESNIYPFQRVRALQQRGAVHANHGHYDEALSDLNHAIRIDDDNPGAYATRGQFHLLVGEFGLAEADFDHALELYRGASLHKFVLPFRAKARLAQANYAGAAADFEELVRLDRRGAASHNSAAWFFATCPDERYRDGDRAVALATRAMELDDGWPTRDTLAAAYAEAGRFEDAAREQLQAISDATAAGVEDLAALDARLALYQAGEAFHEPPPADPPR